MTAYRYLRQAAHTLRVAADYIDAHGYHIPLSSLPDDPEFPGYTNPALDRPDFYDPHTTTPATPAASEQGAIAYAAYGRLNPEPIDDDSTAFRRYADAVMQLSLFYAPDGEGYGDWTDAESLADD